MKLEDKVRQDRDKKNEVFKEKKKVVKGLKEQWEFHHKTA